MGISNRSMQFPAASRWQVSLVVAALVVLGALLPQERVSAAKSAMRNAEDLLIVDCLLPGQVRRLGAAASFMSARRPIRTTQADCEIRGGEYVSYDRANYQTALKVWMDQAMAGSAEAQNYVGEIYSKGLGTPPDYEMAALWFKKAAEQGLKRAKINLGYLYEQGLGVGKDLTQALNLYRDASGISGDDIVFASTVQVQMQAKEAEISGLKDTVESQRRESEALRREVQELRGQLDNRRAALEQSERELESTRLRLNQARAATGADFTRIDAARSELSARASELDRESARLREEQEALSRQTQASEARLAELRARETELSRQSDPAEDTRRALADIRSQTGELSKALADAQARAAAMQGQLATNQSLLDRERESYQAEIAKLEAQAAGRKQEDWELMKLLENQLSAKESEIREQQERIASLERRVVVGSGGAIAAAIPTLEIIDPPLTATRGRPAAMLRRAPGSQPLVGKISAPQGVQSVAVNGRPAALDAKGVFRSSVDVVSGGTLVQIAAVDTRGVEAQLEFMMIPQGEGGGATAGTGSVPRSASGVPGGVKLGAYHALVIGNNTYQSNSYPALKSAVNDATAVAQVLRDRYGYKTQLLLNATRFDILSALNDLRERLSAEDNLLVYYAGHGELSTDGQQGYWIPVDAQKAAPTTWISNSAISSILETMQARHVLVVADSCYSGAMTRSSVATFDAAVMPADRWAEWVRTMSDGRSRTALTSGGVQPVPDTGSGKHSYFARAFLNVLEDNNRLLEAQRVFREVSSTLALASVNAPITQVPEYSPIRYAGHEAGEFFFAPRAGSRATGP